jgi:SAM-dependent methyltransferase
MVQMPLPRIALAVAENAAKRTGVTPLVNRIRQRHACGGVRWRTRPIQENVTHVRNVAYVLTQQLGEVTGQVGAEIGPGDNLGVGYQFRKRGAARVYGVEKFGSVAADEWSRQLFEALDVHDGRAPLAAEAVTPDGFGAGLALHRCLFEDFQPGEPLDFIVSYDVLEHVNPESVFRHAFTLLRPGGRFVNVVDFTGHGPFYDMAQPLSFLTCPDWLWNLMFSGMETTNRVRHSEMLAMARAAGFHVSSSPIRLAPEEHLARVRPHLLPRYQPLADDDLRVMQCLVVLTKPTAAES